MVDHPQVALQRYRRYFQRSVCTELLVATAWVVVIERKEEQTTLDLALGWAVTGSLVAMALSHFALLKLQDRWTTEAWLAYATLVLSVVAALLLISHAFLTARSATKTAAKVGAYALTIVSTLYSCVKIRLHAKFVFDVRRAKDEADLAHYLALEGRHDSFEPFDVNTSKQRHHRTPSPTSDQPQLSTV